MLQTARLHALDVASPGIIGASWGDIMGPNTCACDYGDLRNWYGAPSAAFRQANGTDHLQENGTQHGKPAPLFSCASPGCQSEGASVDAEQQAGCVRKAPFLESYALLFRPAAWSCYHAMMSLLTMKETDSLRGWGYDVCYTAYCPHVANQAILLGHVAVHDPSRSVLRGGRTLARLCGPTAQHTQRQDQPCQRH